MAREDMSIERMEQLCENNYKYLTGIDNGLIDESLKYKEFSDEIRTRLEICNDSYVRKTYHYGSLVLFFSPYSVFTEKGLLWHDVNKTFWVYSFEFENNICTVFKSIEDWFEGIVFDECDVEEFEEKLKTKFKISIKEIEMAAKQL